MKNQQILIKGEGICKSFPGVWEHLILDHVDLDIRAGEIHTLLGENGAGKTVIADILSGLYSLSEGQIYVRGEPVEFKCPEDGISHGIGMVHQELSLVKSFTVAENIALGASVSDLSFPLREIEAKTKRLSEEFNLPIDPKAKIQDLAAGEQQKAEIIKALYHKPEVLILDEPTSLISSDAEHLFRALEDMTDSGYGILFISHKVEEALAIGDRITVLRLGKKVATLDRAEASKQKLVKLMFGKSSSIHIQREPVSSEKEVLRLVNISCQGSQGETALKKISLKVREGEILGIAGVSGQGQKELAEVITGFRKVEQGQVIINGKDYTNSSPQRIIEAGVAHIPEQRRARGVVEPMPVAENVVLKDIGRSPFSRRLFLNISSITNHAENIVSRFKAVVPDLWQSPTRILSGGNIQRLILGRETWNQPPLIIASYPTHGLDVKAVKHTWELFMELRSQGSAIVLIADDLDEIITLSDRIAVIREGKIAGILEAEEVTKETIGSLMTTEEGFQETKEG